MLVLVLSCNNVKLTNDKVVYIIPNICIKMLHKIELFPRKQERLLLFLHSTSLHCYNSDLVYLYIACQFNELNDWDIFSLFHSSLVVPCILLIHPHLG